MKLPRWTVYPALGLLAAMLVMAFPHPQGDQHRGAARQSRQGGPEPREGRRAPLEELERDALSETEETDPAAVEPQGPESERQR